MDEERTFTKRSGKMSMVESRGSGTGFHPRPVSTHVLVTQSDKISSSY